MFRSVTKPQRMEAKSDTCCAVLCTSKAVLLNLGSASGNISRQTVQQTSTKEKHHCQTWWWEPNILGLVFRRKLITVNCTVKKEQYIKINSQSAEKLGLRHLWTFQHDNDPNLKNLWWELTIRVMARKPHHKNTSETCKKLVSNYRKHLIDH